MIKVFPVQAATRQIVSLKGNVVRPGEYQYRKGMRLTDLIPGYKALLPDTYLESVEITRLAPPDSHYELLTANLRQALAGNESENIQLQEQDTVTVFSRSAKQEKQLVSVNGAVLNPGSFNYYPGMTVRDLLAACRQSETKRHFWRQGSSAASISRGTRPVRRDSALNLNKALAGDPQHNLLLQPDDVLIVRGVAGWFDASDKFITLKGEVRYPGTYSVNQGEKLSSVIARAGGYTEKAYLRGAKLLRRSVREAQQKRMDEVVARTEKQVLSKQAALAQLSTSKEEVEATKAALESLMKGIELVKKLKAEGRVVISLSELDELQPEQFRCGG